MDRGQENPGRRRQGAIEGKVQNIFGKAKDAVNDAKRSAKERKVEREEDVA